MSEIIVTAGRTPLTFSSLARSVVLMDEYKIKSIPVNNIQDVLKYIGGVDFKSRGVEGVQGDVSIRGGTFEQTLILINGMRMSDPQTAHHNLNIPVSLDNVERIEILKGQGWGFWSQRIQWCNKYHYKKIKFSPFYHYLSLAVITVFMKPVLPQVIQLE